MSDENEKVLNNFLSDISCLDELKNWETAFNIFDVLRIAKNEIRHSNVLCWLLDANENHGLGGTVLYRIFVKILENNPNFKYKQSKLFLLDFNSFDVKREEEHIDILLTSAKEKFVVAIENKIFSGEHDNQLDRYRQYIEKQYEGYDKVFIYLTPDGDDSSDADNWVSLSYRMVYEAIEESKKEIRTTHEVEQFINYYLEILRRDVMDDQELREICNKIYEKHKKALDLIYNNCERGTARYYRAIRAGLSELASNNLIIYPNSNSTSFYLQELDEIIPFMAEPNSSWGTDRCYGCWIEIDWKNRLVVHLELGGFNLSPQQKEITNKLIENGHGKMKRYEDYQYQRIEKEAELLKDDEDSFDNIKQITINRVKKMKKKVADLIESIK